RARTVRARSGALPWFSAAALAFVAGVEFRDFNLFFGAKRRLLQLDLHVVAQIRSAPPIFCPIAGAEERLEDSAAESTAAENFPENLERIVENAAAKTSAARPERGGADAVGRGA